MSGSESWGAQSSQAGGQGGSLRSIVLVLLGALLAVLVGGVGLVVGMGMSKDDSPAAAPPGAEPGTVAPVARTPEPTSTEEPTDEPSEEPEADGPRVLANDELAEEYGDSVFKVEVEGCQMEGWGTAWVLDEQHLVTNWHVVSVDPTPVIVDRESGTRLQGTVIGGHLEPDVAVIRVDEQLPEPLPWADTDVLREGQEIVSLGFPAPVGDFSVTPSTIISFQKAGATKEAIRGDGAIDYGNSGGPALTRDGEVAGVATLMLMDVNRLQMVPLLFTADALRPSVERILADPQAVEAECDPEFAMLPDDWAPDFDNWSSDGPQAYGDDPALDELYDSCAAGNLEACDELWMDAPYGSEYEAFAMSCGGSSSEPAFGSCQSRAEWAQLEEEWAQEEAAEAAAEEAERAAEEAEREAQEAAWEAEEAAREAEEQRQQEQAAAAIAALVGACESGDMQACDDLSWEAEYGSAAYDVAEACGGHYPDGWGGCVDQAAEADALQVLVGECTAGDMEACDDLWWTASDGSPEAAVAEDCGGMFPGEGGMCAYLEEYPE